MCVSVPGHVSWGLKSLKLVKFGKEVLNMCYRVFRVEMFGYNSPRTTLGSLRRTLFILTKKLSQIMSTNNGTWRGLVQSMGCWLPPSMVSFLIFHNGKMISLGLNHGCAIRWGSWTSTDLRTIGLGLIGQAWFCWLVLHWVFVII